MSEKDNNSDEMKREAENQKELGNKWFKSGNIEESIKCYSNAIKMFSLNPIFYLNRSIAYLKKGLAIEAENDCNLALNIDSTCIKGYYRRGMARKCLHRYWLASDDFKQVLRLDPNNRDAKRELESIQSLIDSKTFVNIKPIDKRIEFQSNQPLIQIPINSENTLKTEFEFKLPESSPKTYYQFECDWRQMVGKNSIELRLKYLEMIGSDGMETLLTTSGLEPQMMSDLFNTISNSNDPKLIYSVLNEICKTSRFDALVLFMSDTDKNILKSLIEKLKQKCSEKQLITELETKYLF